MARKNGKGNKKSGGKGKERVVGIVKAIQDLKVDTQVRGSPRIADVPRIFIKNRKVYTIAQTYSVTTISITTANFSGAYAFTLSSIPLSTSVAGVFDTYKIQQVTVRFIPLGTLPAGQGGFAPMCTVIDYDDNTALSSVTQAQAYDTCQESPLGNYIERTLVPRVAIASYGSGAFTSYAQQRSWIDVNSNAVAHYGLKAFSTGSIVAYPSLYAVEADLVVSFMSVR